MLSFFSIKTKKIKLSRKVTYNLDFYELGKEMKHIGTLLQTIRNLSKGHSIDFRNAPYDNDHILLGHLLGEKINILYELQVAKSSKHEKNEFMDIYRILTEIVEHKKETNFNKIKDFIESLELNELIELKSFSKELELLCEHSMKKHFQD
jgi:hypothetical protein